MLFFLPFYTPLTTSSPYYLPYLPLLFLPLPLIIQSSPHVPHVTLLTLFPFPITPLPLPSPSSPCPYYPLQSPPHHHSSYSTVIFLSLHPEPSSFLINPTLINPLLTPPSESINGPVQKVFNPPLLGTPTL